MLALVCVCGGIGLLASRGGNDVPAERNGGAVEFVTATALPVPATFTAIPSPTDTSVPPTVTSTPSPTNTPAPPTATPVPLKLEVLELTSPVVPNSKGRAVIVTEPGAHCSIDVFYKSGASKADGLEPMVAGDDGRCAWSWDIGPKTAAVESHVTFRVVLNSRRAEVQVPFVVQ